MKKKILALLLCIIMILPVLTFTGCGDEEQEEDFTPSLDANDKDFVFDESRTLVRPDADPAQNTTFSFVQENDRFELYFSKGILEIALKDKESGEIWFSNPTPSERMAGLNAEMSSQISLFYLTKSTTSQNTLESYLDCILEQKEDSENKQYYIVNHEGHLRIVYILGRVKKDYTIPSAFLDDDAEDLTKKLRSGGFNTAVSWVTKGGIYSAISPKVWETYSDDKRGELLAIAPNMEDYIKEGHTVYIIGNTKVWNNEFMMDQLEEAFTGIGMTKEDRDNYNEIFGVVPEKPQTFWIPVDYVLTENGLNVTVPQEEIHYNTSEFAISTISLLKYFGSGSREENGYMFVPDGSGAVINFNNGKTSISSPIRVQLYGIDDGRDRQTKPFANENASLPVFGIKKENSALFAMVESGDTNLTVISDIAGKNKNVVDRNVCYPSFKMSEYEDLSFSSAGKLSRIYQANMNSADLSVTYTILNGEKANYSGMAEFYRNYLIEKGVLKKQNFTDVPFNVELVGAYDHDTAFLGVAYNEMRALTTFDQAKEMIKQLSDAGIKNISLNYKGWSNNGLRNTVFNKIKVLNALGGKNGLSDLMTYAESIGVIVYLETELAFVYESALFDGYSQLTDACRMVTRDVAHHYQYYQDWLTASEDNVATIVSPSKIYNLDAEDNSKSNAVKVLNDLNKLNAKGVSLGSLGEELSGNYKLKDFYDRDKTAKTYAAVAELYSKDMSVMAKGANGYLLPYLDTIYEISNTSSMFNLADQSVPFYQMVIHGSIGYSGEPVNLNGDARKTMLQAVEAGAGLYYRWCYVSNDKVQDLWFEGMYALSYKSWFDDAVAMYKEYNEVMAPLAGQYMVSHEAVAKDVNKVIYEDGTVIYINYTAKDFTADDGTVVPANGFVKGGK